MAREGVTFFEVDQPATQADKRARAPEGGPVYVPADATDPRLTDKLSEAGFQPQEPTAFMVEGLTIYLTKDDVGAAVRPARRPRPDWQPAGGELRKRIRASAHHPPPSDRLPTGRRSVAFPPAIRGCAVIVFQDQLDDRQLAGRLRPGARTPRQDESGRHARDLGVRGDSDDVERWEPVETLGNLRPVR